MERNVNCATGEVKVLPPPVVGPAIVRRSSDAAAVVDALIDAGIIPQGKAAQVKAKLKELRG